MEELYEISRLPALLLTVVILAAVWDDLRHDLCRLVRGRNVVLLGMGAWYLLEACMLPTSLRIFNQAQYNLGILYVGVALAGFLWGYHYTSGCSMIPAFVEKITLFDDEKWLWRLVLIGSVIGFAPVVYYTGTQYAEMLNDITGMRVTWGGMLGRGRYGDARAAFLMLELFITGVAPFAAILLFKRGSPLGQRLLCALVNVWVLLRAYGTGTRSTLIAVSCFLAAVIYWKATPSLRRKLICALLLCTPLIYGLMAAMVSSRTSGSLSWENVGTVEYVGNEMFRELLFITSKVSSGELDFQYGYGYYVQLVNPIPRFLWPAKPTLDAGILMSILHGEVDSVGHANMIISPGIIGEMYMNFGVGGIFGLSLFGGWLVKGWDQIPRLYWHSLSALVYFTAGLGVLFIMGRSVSMSMFYGLLSLALLAWLICFLNPHAVAHADSTPALDGWG